MRLDAIFRILFVIYCIEAGLLLLVAPWNAGLWDRNWVQIADPALLFARLDTNGDGKIVPDELPECRAKGIKIVANAGGVNPQACRKAVANTIRQLGISGVKIGVDRAPINIRYTYQRIRCTCFYNNWNSSTVNDII